MDVSFNYQFINQYWIYIEKIISFHTEDLNSKLKLALEELEGKLEVHVSIL